ncbi:TPA: aldehyde dehydrogenase family protein [Klebsiella pneumoniae]
MKATTQQFLNQSPLPFYVAGQWINREATLKVTDPASGEQIALVCRAGAVDVDAAMQAAESAASTWQALTPAARGERLTRLGDLIDAHTQELAELESIDVGKTLAGAIGFDVPYAAQCFRYFARIAQDVSCDVDLGLSLTDGHVIKKPYGVCGFIFPWNFPLTLCAWGIAPALAAGNTVVIKPASETPLSTLYLAKLAAEAGIPAGVINVLPGSGGEVGETLIAHPRLKHMSFTGSTEVGRHIAEVCGRNLVPVKLELGGKGAAVIFDDADIAAAVDGLVGAVTLNCGQVCCTATRWYVHEAIAARFSALAVEKMNAIRTGKGLLDSSDMGPICTKKQLHKVLECIAIAQSHGARILCGGVRDLAGDRAAGHFIRPTLLAADDDNPMVQEEIFGPVACLLTFKDEDEVIARVNRNPYGLANSVWTQDRQRAQRVAAALVSGNSWINVHNLFEYGLPYGACNQSGYGGGVNSPETLEGYLRKQAVAGLRQETV